MRPERMGGGKGGGRGGTGQARPAAPSLPSEASRPKHRLKSEIPTLKSPPARRPPGWRRAVWPKGAKPQRGRRAGVGVPALSDFASNRWSR